MSPIHCSVQLLKYLTLTGAFLVAVSVHAEIPKKPTREQIIASCVIEKVTVQERVALQQCKTKLDAAELLQSMYQDRLDEVKALGKKLTSYEYISKTVDTGTTSAYRKEVELVNTFGPLYRDALEEIKALIVTLKAAPSTRKKR